MSSRLQLDVRNLSPGRRHLVNACEVEAGRCNLQVKLCDPYLSGERLECELVSVRYYNKELYKSTSFRTKP